MKIAIIGVGTVGSAVATAVQNTGLVREIVLYDRDEIRARAAAEDLGHASTFNFDIKINAINDYREIQGSEVVIIAAGANQKPGQNRMDLLQANSAVIRDIVPRVMKNVDQNRVILIIVTNPLDIMVMLAQELSGLPESRVIGTGTMLDSARFKIILSRHLGISTHSINSYVLGEHGDSSVLNWSATTIGNLPLDDFCEQIGFLISPAARKTIEYRVHNAAYEIIQGRGATWDGIGAVVADLLRCIINDEKRILTVSKKDSFNKEEVAISLPRIIGYDGVIDTLIPKMNTSETKGLKESAEIIRQGFDKIV
ncbi:MAG: L-lactate dehydrogenase [Alphaproteobacteria bacterium]|nr:L-lactate dehydrogenase [Alphaproteobacteria bacterium]MBN2675460.1 L-lactate dehydrogenase [Alphaproteobacteria bacterium]